MAQPILKSHSKTIKFDYDIEEFKANIQRLIEQIKGNTKEILIEASSEFAKQASKYTPPCIGKNSIEKKYYTRPILHLKTLITGGYSNFKATAEDLEQFRHNKMKYKVVNTKKGAEKDAAYGYCKTKSEAKKMAKISNRGLARILWGKSLPDIAAEIPNNIVRLMGKSPNMTDKKLSEAKYAEQNEEGTITINNKFKNLSSFGRLAQKHGLKKVTVYINKKVKQITEKDQEV